MPIPSPFSPRISITSERTAEGLRQKDGVKAKPCQCDPEIGRNLVVCIDGTANQFGLQVKRQYPLALLPLLIVMALHRTAMWSNSTAG